MTDDQSEAQSANLELVSFWLGQQEFCVDIMSIREIRGWTAETPLPHSPDFVRGVINLRGVVLPIVDLAARFGVGITEPSQRHVIIVVQMGEQMVGLLVDAVSNIFEVDKSVVQPTPNVGNDKIRKFVCGLLAIDERMINLVEINEIMPTNTKVAA